MNTQGGRKGTIIFKVIMICTIIAGIATSGGCSSKSSSSYQLHNKDGSINWEYYNDMQDYFEKHPEKLP